MKPFHGWVSASSMPLAGKCASSQVLQRVFSTGGKDRMGSALHAHLFERVHFGIDESIARLPMLAIRFELDEKETSIFIARAKGFTWTPPRGALPEIGLCLYEDGSVRPVQGGRGQYDPGEGALIPMQIDVFWAEPEPLYRDADGRVRCPPGSILWVVDFKAGSENYVDAVEKNLQTLAAVVAAAKFTGAKAAVPGVLFLRKGPGEWDVPEAALDTEQLVKAEDLLRKVVHRVQDGRKKHAAGEDLTYVTGPHCTYCAAEAYCPAKLAVLKGYLDAPDRFKEGALTNEQAVRLAELYPSIGRLHEQAKAALTAHVQRFGSLTLSNGKHWGPYPHEEQVLDVDKAIAAMREEGITDDEIRAGLRRSISKDAINGAISAAHDRQEIARQKSKAFGRIMGRLRDNGGIRTVVSTWFGFHTTPPPGLEPGEVASAKGLPTGVPIEGDDV